MAFFESLSSPVLQLPQIQLHRRLETVLLFPLSFLRTHPYQPKPPWEWSRSLWPRKRQTLTPSTVGLVYLLSNCDLTCLATINPLRYPQSAPLHPECKQRRFWIPILPFAPSNLVLPQNTYRIHFLDGKARLQAPCHSLSHPRYGNTRTFPHRVR